MGGNPKSYTTSTSTDISSAVDLTNSGVGSTTSNNTIVGAGAKIDGMTDALARDILSFVSNAGESIIGMSKDTIATVNSATSNTNKQITDAFNNAYATEKATLENLKPYALYGLGAFVLYMILKGK